MAAGSSPPLQCCLALIILVLQWPEGAVTIQEVPLSNLFANAVTQTVHLHSLAAATYKEFGQTHISEDQRNSMQPAACYSETIPAPNKKDDVLQTSDIELLRFSHTFIQSWLGPMQSLSTDNLVFKTSDTVDAKLKDLEEGIQVIMQNLGGENSQGARLLVPGYDNFEASSQDDASLLKNYGLLSCFKTDMHKVMTYLRVICRRLEGISCPA